MKTLKAWEIMGGKLMTNDLEHKLSELESICKSVKSGGPDYTSYPDEMSKLIKALRVAKKRLEEIIEIERAIKGESSVLQDDCEDTLKEIQQIMCGGSDE